MPLNLPSREAISLSIDNGTRDDYDLVRLYYTWYSHWFYRNRLRMVADMMGDTRVNRILEVGTGSGIFIQEVLKRAETMAGIDIHASFNGVRAMLEKEGVDLSRVELRQGSIFEIPYPDHSFDAAVCISVLEHFKNPGPAVEEMWRVVKPGGFLALGFPAHTLVTDGLFRSLGYETDDIHPATHGMILNAIRGAGKIEKLRVFPAPFFPMYFACRTVREA